MKPPGNQWSPGEAAAVNQFLNTPVGVKWLQELYSRKPKVDQTSMERAAISGVFSAGFEKAWEEISNTRVALQTSESASTKAIDPTKD